MSEDVWHPGMPDRRGIPDRRATGLTQSDRRFMVLTTVFFGIPAVVSIIFALLYIVRPNSLLSPDYEYSNTTLIGSSELCPGDSLRYSYHLTVHRAPLLLSVVRSFYSIDRGYNMVPDDSPDAVAHAVTRPSTLVEREITVPDALPPGRYELHHASHQDRAVPLVMTFPFTVREDCS